MARVALEGGGWYDPDKAETWEEGTRWDGRNHVSLATGSQWDHEELHRTAKGVWVLRRWSQWQGSRETHERIDAEAAAEWLVRNGREPPAELAEEVAAAEAASTPAGRTKLVSFRLDPETLALLERYAAEHGISHTDVVRLGVRAFGVLPAARRR